jgi:hypothetical protein
MSKPILCCDFDGVIHSYTSKWTDEATISDPPVPGALRWLWAATEWWDVQIYSSRSKSSAGVSAMQSWLETHAAHEWGDLDFARQFVAAFKFPTQKPAAFLTIDDRAVCFEGDWGELDPCELLNFRPWNKREPLGATVRRLGIAFPLVKV